MKVAVVILNWNGKSLLSQFLPSVVTHSPGATIYVADNASTDGSVEFLKNQYPAIKIINHKDNFGYAKGYNLALKEVSESLLVLLNSDVAVTENWLTPIIQAFEEDANLAAAQPKILDYNNKAYFEYAGAAGGFLDALGYPYCRGRIFNTIEKDTGQYNDSIPILWATGACLFVRQTAFMKVHGFDEDLFAHQEEIDLCWRLRAQGYSIQYVGASKVYHVGGATLAAANPKKTFYNFRNTLLILLKNVKGFSVWYKLFFRMVLDAVAFFQFIFSGKPKHAIAILKAHLSFYTLLNKFLKKRKTVASNTPYYSTLSIVWQYFIKGKRQF